MNSLESAQAPARTVRLLLAALSQTSAFEPPGRLRQAPEHHSGNRNPSQVSNGLRIHGHVARGCYSSEPASFEPVFRQAKVSTFSHDFGGPKVEAPPLPTNADLFAVRHRLRRHSPASPSGPFMVELFVGGFYRPHAEPYLWPGSVCRQTKTPHAGLVKRTSRDFHPICANKGALVRIPRTGLARETCFTRFEPSRPRPKFRYANFAEVFPCRPLHQNWNGIEHWDYSGPSLFLTTEARSGITPTSLPRTGRATLMASGSTGRHQCGWLIRALRLTGEASFTERCRPSRRPS